ncbi:MULTISPECIES: DAK2 domain-containing protein [unclassified Isoptericola]|uniref:DAK2 domain-containing protein n=1 Tax=unclassified Isoptericola TaxID=2623355 RepID=UPI00365069F8
MTDPDLRDAAVVRLWVRTAVEALGGARTALDGVNVFPVADGDTGTNLYLTLREGAHTVQEEPGGAGGARLLRVLARGALLGARGNSGVILSEWLRGLAAAATRGEPVERALGTAARTARLAVARPAPGTILTAAEAAAVAARAAAPDGRPGAVVTGSDLHRRQEVLDAARAGAREALLTSAGSLAALRDAGVLDAGAGGLLLVLGALAEAHRAVSEAPGTMAPVTGTVTLDVELRQGEPRHGDAESLGPAADAPAHDDALELMFVLHRPAAAADFGPGAVADALRRDLDAVGESVVVVGGADEPDEPDDLDVPDEPAVPGDESLWQAHVHTTDLAGGLDVARRWAADGAVSRVHVRHLAVLGEHGAGSGVAPDAPWGAVVATSAPALAGELARGGAVVLLDLDLPVTPDDLAQAALGVPAERVLVLPGPVPGGAGALDRALAAHRDPGAAEPAVVLLDAPDDASVVTAVAALAEVGQDEDGDGGGDMDGDGGVPAAVRAALARLTTWAGDGAAAARALGDLLAAAPDAELVTVLADAAAPPGALDDVVRAAAAGAPDAEVVVLATGRPGAGVTIGVETVGVESIGTES